MAEDWTREVAGNLGISRKCFGEQAEMAADLKVAEGLMESNVDQGSTHHR